MRKFMSVMTAALALGVVVPLTANAQSRDRGRVTAGDVVRPAGSRDRDNRDVRDRRDGRDDDWYDRRNDRRDDDWNRNDRNSRGPAFCRSGAGHPVHGRAWCREKGYSLGNNYGRWDHVTWRDVIFRRRPRDASFGSVGLYDLLGRSVFDRLDAQRRHWGVNAPLVGRWNAFDGRSVLQVSAGGIALAELVDRNGDRRVDYISLHRR